jgi:hypothetical protein
MAIVQKTATVNSAPNQIYRPITTQADAISAQQTVLSSAIPKSDAEAAAVKTQLNLLNNYQVVENQQAVVSTAYVTTGSQLLASSLRNASAISQLDKEAQIKALATPGILPSKP